MARGFGPGSGRARERAGGERGELEDGIADRPGVVACVGGVRLRVVQVARQQRGQAEREPQADAVRRRLRRQLAEGDVEAARGILVAAEPPFLVGQGDGEREPVVRSGARQRAEQGLARGLRVARGGLGVGAQPLEPGAALALRVRQQPHRSGMEAGRGGRSRRLELGRGGAEERDRVLVAGAGGVLDVVRSLHRSGAPAFQLGGGAGVRADPPPARRRDVDRVADHRMAEREPAWRAGRPHERLDEELVERSQGCGLRHLGDGGGQAGLEGIAPHGGRLEDPARLGRQRGELRGQRGGDRARHRAVPDRSGRARRDRDPRELLEKERVAAGLRIDRRSARSDELGRLGLAQRRQPERGETVLAVRGRERRAERRRQLALPRREREQPASPRSPPARAARSLSGESTRAPDRRRGQTAPPLHPRPPAIGGRPPLPYPHQRR